ncbi:methionyl-tRNA formyltransferase [Akkermansiaceae bacterium]|nr:methionyl-tRNA formyltransferase [Akkermansiaceae bacterium]
MNIIFMATGDIAIPTFKKLVESKHEITLLVTQPDKPVGRKQILTPPKIKQLALEHGIEVLQPEKIRQEGFVDQLSSYSCDVTVVMAYGQILPQSVLELPKLACINLHASLLPKYRGSACIQAPIVNGDIISGVTIMHMSKGLDEGDIILKDALTISSEDTGGTLHDKLALVAPTSLMKALEKIESGIAKRLPQNADEVSYVNKLLRNDGEIDWELSAVDIERIIRAYDPWPATFTLLKHPKKGVLRLKLFPNTQVISGNGNPGEIIAIGEDSFTVSCGSKSLIINEVQLEGSRRMSVADFLKSNLITLSTKLGLKE